MCCYPSSRIAGHSGAIQSGFIRFIGEKSAVVRYSLEKGQNRQRYSLMGLDVSNLEGRLKHHRGPHLP